MAHHNYLRRTPNELPEDAKDPHREPGGTAGRAQGRPEDLLVHPTDLRRTSKELPEDTKDPQGNPKRSSRSPWRPFGGQIILILVMGSTRIIVDLWSDLPAKLCMSM